MSDDLENVIAYFDSGSVLQMGDTAASSAALEGFRAIPALVDAVRELGLANEESPAHLVGACELVLEALVADRRISRSESGRYTRAPRRTPPGGMPPSKYEG